MGETETLRFIGAAYGEMICEAASNHGHRPGVLAGIVMRETDGGLSKLLDRQGPEGRRDRPKGEILKSQYIQTQDFSATA